jgi:hypothetical protein
MQSEMAFGIGAETPTPTPSPTPEPEPAAGGVRRLPYWKPTLVVQIIPDWSVYPSKASIPPHVVAEIHVEPSIPAYLPITVSAGAWRRLSLCFFSSLAYAVSIRAQVVNDFWLLGHHLIAINDTVQTVPLTVSFGPTVRYYCRDCITPTRVPHPSALVYRHAPAFALPPRRCTHVPSSCLCCLCRASGSGRSWHLWRSSGRCRRRSVLRRATLAW